MPRKRQRVTGEVSTSQVFGPTDHAAEGLTRSGSGHLFNEKPWKAKSRRRGRPVDLFHALKASNIRKDPNVEIVCGRLEVETDPLQYAEPFGAAVAKQMHDNIIAGKTPAGRQSKPLDRDYEAQREGNGPRGVNTGQTVNTMRVESGTGLRGLGRAWCFVKMTLPDKRAWGRMFAGARFTYNPRDKIIDQALRDIVDMIVLPEKGTG